MRQIGPDESGVTIEELEVDLLDKTAAVVYRLAGEGYQESGGIFLETATLAP